MPHLYGYHCLVQIPLYEDDIGVSTGVEWLKHEGSFRSLLLHYRSGAHEQRPDAAGAGGGNTEQGWWHVVQVEVMLTALTCN